MYTHMLPQRKLMLRFNNQGVPAWEDRLLRCGWPVIVRWAKRELGIRPGVEVEDEAAVWREFDFVAELLADGRAHLCGDRFGAADLTFAALSASMIVPPVYGVPLPQPDILPPHIAALVERARDHPPAATRSRCSSSTAGPACRPLAALRLALATRGGIDGFTRSQRAGRSGSHQFQRPNSDTAAGTSRALSTIASNRIPAANPVASIFTSVPGLDASDMNARNRISAALVTSRPVRPMPRMTACSVEPVASYSSRMRARMNTS